MEKLGKESVYVDLENPEDLSMLTDPILFFKNNQEKCVVLDEVQRMPELFPVMESERNGFQVSSRPILNAIFLCWA